MNPYRLKNVFEYLTSNNQLLKKKLKLGTSEIPIPPKRDDVTTIEAINRFNKANPRLDTTNLKPLSVKHSKVKQSNVGEADEGVIQSAFDTATRDAQFEGYPAPSYEKFKSRYLKKNMKADGGMLVQPSDDGSRPGYMGKNVMSGSPAQQAENIRRENESLKKISDLFKKKDYTGLKTRTPTARIKQGMEDKGGKLNTPQVNKITKAMEGGLKTQKDFAKKLGITHKQFLEGVEKSKSKISLEKSEKLSKQQLKKIEFQEKLFKEIVDNPNATVDSMMKKFKVDKKYLVSQSSKLLKNVYSQNVSIAKGPEFDLDSRGKATLKSWLPNDFDTTEKFLGRFANIDGFKKIQSENMGKLLFNAYGKTDPKKYANAMKALTEYNNFKNNLPKGLNVDLDHPLSKVFLKGSGVSPDKLLYVTPVNRDFNRGFKMQMGNRYAKALLQGDKTAIKNVKALANKLKINIGDVKGSKLDFGTTKFDTNKNFALEYFKNLKEQNLVANNLKNLQKTTDGKQLIKDAGFKSGQVKEVQKINKTVMKKIMAFCPAGTATVTKAGGGRVPYADGPVCTLEEAARGMNEKIEKIKKGNATAGETSRTINKFKNLGTLGMRGLLKAGLVSEVLYEAAIGFDKIISEGQSPIQAFRQSYLTAPLRAIGAVKSFEEGEREELLDVASDKGKVGRVLNLQEAVQNRDTLINKINNLETSLQDQKDLDDGSGFFGSTEPLEKNIADLKAQLQDSYRDGQVNRADELFSTKPQDLNIKDQSYIDAYNNAIEKRAVDQASNSFKAQSIAADENRVRDANKAMLEKFPIYTPEIIDSMYERAKVEKPENLDYADFGKQMSDYDKMNYFADNFRLEKASGGIASLTDTIPPESGPTPHGLPYVYNNVKKI